MDRAAGRPSRSRQPPERLRPREARADGGQSDDQAVRSGRLRGAAGPKAADRCVAIAPRFAARAMGGGTEDSDAAAIRPSALSPRDRSDYDRLPGADRWRALAAS